MDFKNKRILITAGPTWVPIDRVRVISNTASGQTGCLLAQKLVKSGAQVTLLLGPSGEIKISKRIKLVRFKFFDELKSILLKELRSKKYDILIHSAAVSDYKLKSIKQNKIKSDNPSLSLVLVPTEKIIDLVKLEDKKIFLVGFKFELGMEKSELIRRAKSLIRHSNSDLIVANTVSRNRYQAYLVDKESHSQVILSKKDLINKLMDRL